MDKLQFLVLILFICSLIFILKLLTATAELADEFEPQNKLIDNFRQSYMEDTFSMIFCGFWFVAVNTMDKLQFLVLILFYHRNSKCIARVCWCVALTSRSVRPHSARACVCTRNARRTAPASTLAIGSVPRGNLCNSPPGTVPSATRNQWC